MTSKTIRKRVSPCAYFAILSALALPAFAQTQGPLPHTPASGESSGSSAMTNTNAGMHA